MGGDPIQVPFYFLIHLISSLIVVLLLIQIAKIIIFYNRGKPIVSTAQTPPGSLGFPFIGETIQFLSANNSTKGFYDFVLSRRLRHGKCFKTNIFGDTHVFMSGSTECAKAVLGSDFVNFNKRYLRSIAQLIGEHSLLLSATQEQHRFLRSSLGTNLGSTSFISCFIKQFDESIINTLADWAQRDTDVIVFEEALKITFKAMCKMIFSLDDTDGELVEMLCKEVGIICEAMLAFPLKLAGTRFYNGLKARKRMMHEIKKIINERRTKTAAKETQHCYQDLLQSLIGGSLSDDANNHKQVMHMSDAQIQDNILTMIIAGQVTTASAMTWMVKYLDENQDLQDVVRDQQLKLAPPGSSALTLENLNEMSLASKVVKETLRMASIVPWLPRVALKDTQIEGFVIKKGWMVNIDAKSIHLDSTVYNDATRFNPARFDEHHLLMPYSFLAFGTGGRTCLGMNLAKSMMIVFLHRLITTYRYPNFWVILDIWALMTGLDLAFKRNFKRTIGTAYKSSFHSLSDM
ncbi:hypothetical protein C5167_037584 [Papaver somniferum]|uniref:Uncharacterized protein n=1 Tax=Papaver somniferum TaxID=3469 RepID=A0A4Y7I744_PAPSO|nr:cytochrome P450 90A1-like isoform X1 [Papaver somniferum]RZC44634.1 hypothetical protein C5167_037584 [Papaver somniferum]